jgi:predicted dehydrogenase
MKSSNSTRREFITRSGVVTAGLALGAHTVSAAAGARATGASEKIRMGFIGVGNRGTQLLRLFMNHADVEIAALCDVYEPYLARDRRKVDGRYLKELGGLVPSMGEALGARVKRYEDYRELLDQPDIDAVCIATPDHWHALQTIHSIQAGKDVYVEKPLSITLREGRLMVEAQARSTQVVAVGLNRRGSSVYQRLSREVAAGRIGKVTVARAGRINNMFPSGIGRLNPETPPADLNWDLWLGPRAKRPYQFNIAPYKFRWWSDYSSQMGNWGVHYLDVIRWMMGETAPAAISAQGGNYAVNDDRDIPDTMQVTYELASGALVSFCMYEASGGSLFPYGEIELRGTKATLHADEGGWRITPTVHGQFQTWDTLTEAEEFSAAKQALADGSSRDSTAALVRNFLDCVKSRQTPLCTLEDGHRSTSFAHLANIALATRERLEWDAINERFTNSEPANQLLHYDYREPWKI